MPDVQFTNEELAARQLLQSAMGTGAATPLVPPGKLTNRATLSTIGADDALKAAGDVPTTALGAALQGALHAKGKSVMAFARQQAETASQVALEKAAKKGGEASPPESSPVVVRPKMRVAQGPLGTGSGPPAKAASPASPSTPSISPALAGLDGASGSPMQGLLTLSTLQQLFPQHQFTPVDYDPFKVMPRGVGGMT